MFLGIISLLIFALTFIPVVYGHFEDFKQMNPFIVQSTFLIPFEYTILFVLIAIGSSFLCKNKNDVYFYNAFVLFVSILIYLAYYVFHQGLTQAFTESAVDISYFIFCIPFALWFIANNNSKV